MVHGMMLQRFYLIDLLRRDVLVRFASFGPEEDEWVNVPRHVRQRSLPCEASRQNPLPKVFIIFSEGKEQALYFDAHVLDAQRRRHDVRGCSCRFLVRYDHDQSEVLHPCASSINIDNLIWNMYFRDLLPRLVKPEMMVIVDQAVCDTICLRYAMNLFTAGRDVINWF
ncbi:hypothetical protein LOK49_LG01G03305 [Camellia lanceoleosa]|uniref:Uncharacterized protein n=1 Tax=Camellia lanceoleosa TaxID=1840588 RepID=A0ACC0IY28_9ERIC|nr:hypothetical protein LOK49_LG01G03305 [Camellia lanceoleosa]